MQKHDVARHHLFSHWWCRDSLHSKLPFLVDFITIFYCHWCITTFFCTEMIYFIGGHMKPRYCWLFRNPGEIFPPFGWCHLPCKWWGFQLPTSTSINWWVDPGFLNHHQQYHGTTVHASFSLKNGLDRIFSNKNDVRVPQASVLGLDLEMASMERLVQVGPGWS